MSRFVNGNIERIDLGEGDWVDVRTRLSYGDREAVRERLYGLRPANAATINDAALHVRDADIEGLVRSIAAWGGPGFCTEHDHPHAGACTPRLITHESVEALDETGERIYAELLVRQRQRTPDFTTAPSPAPSTEAAAVTSSDAASMSSSSSSAPAGRGTN